MSRGEIYTNGTHSRAESYQGGIEKGQTLPLTHEGYLSVESLGQDEGRNTTMNESIIWLQGVIVQYYPDAVISDTNYEMYLTKWLSKQK